MKYLVCLVALLLLCLSPNPSFGQPNSFLSAEVEDLYFLSVEEWPYEDYEKILGTLASLYWKNKDRISQKEAFFSKVKDYINKLIKKKPHIVQELIGKIDELNKEITKAKVDTLQNLDIDIDILLDIDIRKNHSLRHSTRLRIGRKTMDFPKILYLGPLARKNRDAEAKENRDAEENLRLRNLLQEQKQNLLELRTKVELDIGRLLNALAAIIPDSSLDKVARGHLTPDQVKYIESTRNHLAGYGFQFPTAKSESQGKSRSPSKSRKSRSTPPSYDEAATRGPNGNPDSKVGCHGILNA